MGHKCVRYLPRIDKFIETDSRIVGARSSEARGWGGDGFTDTKFPFGMINEFLEQTAVIVTQHYECAVCTQHNVHNITDALYVQSLSCMRKNGKFCAMFIFLQ